MGGGGPETDANVAPILPRLGPIGGIGVNHDGVTIAEKECGRVKGRKGRARKAKRGFLKEAHLDGGPLVSGAAQEGRVVFLKELVAVVAREEASSLAGEAGEPWYAKPVERKRERPQNRYPVAGGSLPRRDAGEGRYSGIHLGVEVEEGGKVDVELRNASKVPDPSGDAVAEKREGGPTGKAEDGRDRAGGLGGDGGGLALAIRTSAGGASKNDAAIPLDGERGEPVGRKDCVGGDEKPAFVQRERYPGGGEDADGVLGNKVRDASVDEEAGVINVGGDAAGGRAATSVVADPNGKCIPGREEGGLKANGIQQGAKRVPLLAASGHVGDQFALTEQRRRTPVGILEPVEQFRRILGEAGADEATRDGVEAVLVIQREENEIVAGVKHQLCHATAYLCAVLDANSELNGKEGVADPVANLGQGHPTNEAIPGVADAKRAGAAVLLGNEDGSGPEPDLGEELSGEHEIAKGGEELTGPPAVRAVPEEDGFHCGIGPSRSAGSSPRW